MATNESDTLGRLAEQEFNTLALRGDITVNKVQVDRHGWDFILQIPYGVISRASPLTLDKLGPELACKIQVKSTEQSKNSCDDINLENWSRMISEPIPWFVAILVYESRNLKEFFLVHIDETLIARALRRLRQVKIAHKDEIHKKFMSLSWTEKDRIEMPLHEGLLKKITSSVHEGFYKYVEKKKRLYQTLGYEDKTAQGTITFESPNSTDPTSLWNVLADHAIGLTPNMPVSMIDLNEVRFGIPVPLDLCSGGKPEDCRIEDPKVDVGQISFHNKRYPSKWVAIDCNFYHAGVVFPFLPKDYQKIRIQTKFVSVIVDPVDNNLNLKVDISIDPEREEPIGDLLKYARFVLICSEGGNGDAFFKLALNRIPEFSDKELPIATASFQEEAIQTAKSIEKFWDILRFFDVDSMVKVNLNHIWNQTETIQLFHTAISPSPSLGTGVITFKSSEDLAGQQVAVVLGGYLIIGCYVLVVIVAFTGICRVTIGLPDSEESSSATDMHHYEIFDVVKELLRHERYLWKEGTKILLRDMTEKCCQALAERVSFVMAPQLQMGYKAPK